MLELLLMSLVTLLPDYLYRRYVQGKRFGKEITFYSVWFELRWGITSCLILTVLLITTVFYNHPSTTNVTLFFRTIPILPEINGRVAEIYAPNSGPIAQGAPIFRLDSSKQEAAVESARRKIAASFAGSMVDWPGRFHWFRVRRGGFASLSLLVPASNLETFQPRCGKLGAGPDPRRCRLHPSFDGCWRTQSARGSERGARERGPRCPLHRRRR